MTVQIKQIESPELKRLVSDSLSARMSAEELVKFNRCMLATAITWGGMAEGKLVCLWGLVPPVLISEMAYLWLYIIEPIGDYEFVFVRHSQRAIEEALKRFPIIVGHCEVGATRSIRWIKWLGGEFGDHEGKFVPFTIRKRADG